MTKRVNFIQQQLDLYADNPKLSAVSFVSNFRAHYVNLASFASSLSKFKSKLKKLCADTDFLDQLKLREKESSFVRAQQKSRLEAKCRDSITLKNCGDNLIQYFRKCLESKDLGPLYSGIAACTGLRMIEICKTANISPPKLSHNTDDVYWCWMTGIAKKTQVFPGHERPLLARRDTLKDALLRLRATHFENIQDITDCSFISSKICKKVNRAVRKSWPFPEVKKVTSHFFRSLYVASSHHYFNQNSSLSAWCADVLAHENLDTTHPYTGLLVTGLGSLSFDSERLLQDMARLRICPTEERTAKPC
jgi:hypothetical protein